MAKSRFVEVLDEIQTEVNSVLRPIGFRKKGRTHTRVTKGGLTHVLDFQKSKYVEERRMFPRFWNKSYGSFAVNLGVFLPCVFEVECPGQPTETITEPHCSIRQRLGHLAYNYDKWFEITDHNTVLVKEVVSLVQSSGLKFLDQFQTYQDVLGYYQENGSLPRQTSHRSHLEAALIANHLNEKVRAQSLFRKAYATELRGFREHVEEIATRVGFTVG